MNPRTTGILAIVALLLGAFIYFHEIRGGDTREEAEALAKRLFPDVEANAIQWMELTTTDGHDARLERSEGVWRLRRPVEFLADGLAVTLASVRLGRSDPERRTPGFRDVTAAAAA